MKIDVANWQLLTRANGFVNGHFHVKVPEPSPIYVHQEGVATLVGYGTELKAEFDGKGQVSVGNGKGKVDAYIYVAPTKSREKTGEKLTSMDKVPDEGGHMSFVKQGLRVLEMQRRQMIAEVKAALSPKKVTPPLSEDDEEKGDKDEQDVVLNNDEQDGDKKSKEKDKSKDKSDEKD